MTVQTPIPTLPWTGERMVPFAADPMTEAFHWQRYLFFRPWYANRRVVDAASGEGYGLGYAAAFASAGHGYDISQEAVEHASHRYPHARFQTADVCEVDYSEAEIVTSFETIEHLPDPVRFLRALARCKGTLAISTPNRDNHSPGNKLKDKPLNPFHTVEWTPAEFADLIREHFPQRHVRFLSQENRWPGLIREGLDPDAKYTLAVIGDEPIPQWPSVGLSMPTCEGAARAIDAAYQFARLYPGVLKTVIMANGSGDASLAKLKEFEKRVPHAVEVVSSKENLGYGRGANLGLARLREIGGFDYLAVTNDDVLPATDCLPQMVRAFQELEMAGKKPGILGPVSNSVNGRQQVDISQFGDLGAMMHRAELYHLNHHSSVTPSIQVRGLMFLISPECLDRIGGFDPVFGMGNFEDDDLNLRARLAGFTLWITDGAFLYHAGSSTFKELGADYRANIARNLSLFLEKWPAASFEQAMAMAGPPPGAELFVSLDASPCNSGYRHQLGCETIDLVHQASDAEFASWLAEETRKRGRESRKAVLQALAS